MPTYFYLCPNSECELTFEDESGMNTFKDHHPNCPECSTVSNYIFIPTVPQFVLKDGASGSWPSKGNRFKAFRAKASAAAEKRQKDRYGNVGKCLPNRGGDIAPSWADARAEALVKDGPEVASTYNAKVAEERATKVG